jgi:hypothetical protein
MAWYPEIDRVEHERGGFVTQIPDELGFVARHEPSDVRVHAVGPYRDVV